MASKPIWLLSDTAFYQKALAEDWTRGDSDELLHQSRSAMKLMADAKRLQDKKRETV